MPPQPSDSDEIPDYAKETKAYGLFRKQALDHFLKAQDRAEPLKISPPWTWSLLWIMAVFTLVGILYAFLGRVEVQNRGKGILRPVVGVRTLQAQVGGVLSQTFFRSGDQIRKDDTIARIEAAQVQGNLLETEQHIQLLQGAGKSFSNQEDSRILDQLRSLRSRLKSQEAQVASYEQSIEIQRGKVTAKRTLLAEGLVSKMDVDDAIEAFHSSQRQRDQVKQGLDQLHQDIASMENQRQKVLWQRTQDVKGAQTKREALESTLNQTLVKAPLDGTLDAFVVRTGDLVQVGQSIAKVIPAGSPLMVVAFVAEKDRAFVKPGDQVALELEAYPYAEFGTLKGRILRIGSDLASSYEVRESFGEDGKLETPSFRVEIELEPARGNKMAQATLRPGMLLQARFTLRRQRIITLVLDPLKRWFD